MQTCIFDIVMVFLNTIPLCPLISTKFPWGVTNLATSRNGNGSKDLVRVFSGMEYNVVGGVGDGFGGAPYKVVGGVGDGFLGSLYDVEGLRSVMDVAVKTMYDFVKPLRCYYFSLIKM